ncbi:MAG: nucleotidyltransferase [Clostridiales bacterium]|nr:nucleotidyltransferase [Clostridiales bacterium]
MKKKEPTLVVLAAGMGSRYGGLKQMDPFDKENHTILDFSVYDAKRAGFKKVVFIIKHAIEEDFVRMIGSRMEPFMDVRYVFQETDQLPEGYRLPEGRVKPFGTGHAVLCCKDVVKEPFAVINADDYYGPKAFQILYQYLTTHEDDDKYRYVMVGFHIENTITENGSVARGICQVDDDHFLTDITERTRIEKRGDCAAYTLDAGKNWEPIPDRTPVSMNCWGFTPGFLDELEKRFPVFLDAELDNNPLKCEFFLPSVVAELLEEEKASVKVLESEEKWYGVTYQEDKETVMEAIQTKKEEGLYPQYLWR